MTYLWCEITNFGSEVCNCWKMNYIDFMNIIFIRNFYNLYF